MVRDGGNVISSYFNRVSTRYAQFSSWTESKALIEAEIQLLKKLLAGEPASCLDLGCGTANHLLRIAHANPGGRSIGVDASMPMLAGGKQLGATELVQSVAEQLPFRENSFDIVLGRQVLHYVDLITAVIEANRTLTPGGHFLSTQQVDYEDVPRSWYQEWSDMRGHLARRRLDESDILAAFSNVGYRRSHIEHVPVVLYYDWKTLVRKYNQPEKTVRAFFENTSPRIRRYFDMKMDERGIRYTSRFAVAAFQAPER